MYHACQVEVPEVPVMLFLEILCAVGVVLLFFIFIQLNQISSAITTRPTHRRRGLLRTMMTRLLEDSVEHGESVSMLTASEASIYERFGYGVSTRAASLVTISLRRRRSSVGRASVRDPRF